jgi:hypothetical protein
VARPAFGGRRALSRIGQLAAFSGVVMLVAASLAFLGGATGPVLDTGAQRLIDGAGATGAAVRIQTRLADDAAAADQDQAMRAAIADGLGDLPATVDRSVLALSAPALVDGESVLMQGLSDPGAADAAELVSGEWPSSADEGALQAAAAERLGVGVGDEVVLGELPVTVVGTWTARDPAAPRWFGDPAVGSGVESLAAGPLLVDESVLAPLDEHPFVRWTILPDRASLGLANLGRWGDALARLDAEVRQLPTTNSSVDVLGTFAETLGRTARSTSIARGIVGLPLVLLLVSGRIVLVLVARAIAAGRRTEFALLRARGASLRSLAAASAREAALAALLGAALGAAAAFAALLWVVRVSVDQGTVLLCAAIGAAVALLSVVLATIVTIVELRAPVTGRAESGRAALIASLGPLLLALVAACISLAQFVALGSPIVVRPDGTVRTDPVALAAPMAVLVAASLLAPVVVGPLSLVAERVARAGRGILPVLPLRQLARRARSVAAGVLVIALAAGAVVLVGVFHLTADTAREAVERAATGADLRVKYAVRSTVGEGYPAASATQVEHVSGVESAFAVLGGTASLGSDAVPLVAGDPRRLAAVTGADPRLTAMAAGLEAGRAVQMVPDGSTELTLTAELTPFGLVPPETRMGVAAWASDPDGSSLYIPMGEVAADVAGAISVTGDLPPGTTGILGLSFTLPTMSAGASVGFRLDALSTDAGDVGWAGAADAEFAGNSRLLPPPPDALPVVLTTALSQRFNAPVGTELGMRMGGLPEQLPLRVTGIADRLPGIAGSLGVMADLQSLEAAALTVGGSVPAANELWLTAPDPDAAVAGLRASLDVRADIVTPSTVSTAPVLVPATGLFAIGTAATLLLAVLGFAAAAAAIGQARRVEFTPLRSLGLTPARVRQARAIELIASALLAIALGAAAGALTAWLVVPGLVAVAT